MIEESRELTKDEKTWGMLCHLSSLAAFIVPLGNIFGPLIIWLVKKDEYQFVNFHGRQSLNFQISLVIYTILSIGMIILGATTEQWVLLALGILLFITIIIADLILFIVAAIKANNGEYYNYPFTIKFLS